MKLENYQKQNLKYVLLHMEIVLMNYLNIIFIKLKVFLEHIWYELLQMLDVVYIEDF